VFSIHQSGTPSGYRPHVNLPSGKPTRMGTSPTTLLMIVMSIIMVIKKSNTRLTICNV
jgi:hypothetical protein